MLSDPGRRREGIRDLLCDAPTGVAGAGYLVGLCASAADPEGHSNQLGAYAGLKMIHQALKEINYKFTPDYGKKKGK